MFHFGLFCSCTFRSVYLRICLLYSWADPEGVAGVRTPLKNHEKLGFLSNTGPYPLKTTKLSSQNSMLDHHRHASETPFKWRFAGGPLLVVFGPYLLSSNK